jgi:hypothetical protein
MFKIGRDYISEFIFYKNVSKVRMANKEEKLIRKSNKTGCETRD